jgi:hypothetical protein
VRRRDFIKVIAGSAAAWPLGVRAQQAVMPVIGFLSSKAPDDTPQLLAAFREGLKATGFVEGQNVTIEYRFANNQNERLPALAVDLVAIHPLMTQSGPAASLARFRYVSRLVPRRVIPLRQQHNRVRVEALILQRVNAADRFALSKIDDSDRAVAHSRQIE